MILIRRKYLNACLKHYAEALAEIKAKCLPDTEPYRIAGAALATHPEEIVKKAKKAKQRKQKDKK